MKIRRKKLTPRVPVTQDHLNQRGSIGYLSLPTHSNRGPFPR